MTDLLKQKCVPCEGGVKPFTPKQIDNYLKLVKGWRVEENRRLVKIKEFEDFMTALQFVNQAGAVAEAEGHHPDISIFSYSKVKIVLYTHAVGGLSENDFILAAKIDSI